MNGTVKFFNSTKGYGFITGEDNKDYFVHVTQLGGIELNEGETVSFVVNAGRKGPEAQDVELA